MSSNLRKIRKVAILVASLDRDAADIIMNQMTPLQARLVRRAMVELGSIDPVEQNDVIEDFFRTAPRVLKDDLEGIELDGQLPEYYGSSATNPDNSRRGQADEARGRSLRFLEHAEIGPLAPLLERERPQTIAVVLSHLSPDDAAALLGRLPQALQVEVTHRMIELDQIDRAALEALEEGVAVWLEQHAVVRQYRSGTPLDGRAVVDRILDVANPETRRNMSAAMPSEPHNLDTDVPPVPVAAAPTIVPPPQPVAEETFKFEDFCELDSITAAAIVGEAYPEIAALALVGADPVFADRVLDQLHPTEAAAIRANMQDLGPTTLADVDLAQKEIARLAQQKQSRNQTTSQSNGRLSVVG